MSSSAEPHHQQGNTPLHLYLLAHAIFDYLHSDDPQFQHAPLSFSPGEMHTFANYVLLNSPWSESPKEAVSILSFALVPTTRPSPGFPSLRAAAGAASKSGVCGKVWKQDELAYKCKTCERDPTCVVCVQCFKLGNHVGHDYAMVRTAGGCCDCGDVQAWRPGGFCSMHSGACAEDDDPSSAMPLKLKSELIEVVAAVAQQVLRLCGEIRKKRDRFPDLLLTNKVCVMLDLMSDMVQCGDGMRRVIGLYLASTPAQLSDDGDELARDLGLDKIEGMSWLSVMLAMDGVDNLPGNIQENLHQVYFQLITDLVFKRAFLERFVENYERYIHAQVARKVRRSGHDDERRPGTDIVENFTVQLFTVPALVPVMIRRGGLLDVLIDILSNLFETCAAPVAPYDKSIPFAKSAFANEYQYIQERARGQDSEPIASSSTTPLSAIRRKKRFLPLPFSTREAHRKDIQERALEMEKVQEPMRTSHDRSQTAQGSNTGTHWPHSLGNLGMLAAGQGAGTETGPGPGPSAERVQEPDLAGVEHRENAEASTSHAFGIGDDNGNGENRELRTVAREDVADEDMDASEEERDNDAMSIDDEENAGTENEPVVTREVVMGLVPGQLEGGTVVNIEMIAAQLEDGGAEVEFPADFVIHFHEQVDGADDDNDGAAGDRRIQEQLSVFEEGMHYAPPVHARLGAGVRRTRMTSPHMHESTPKSERSGRMRSLHAPMRRSPFALAVNEARRMADAAILGTGPIAHPLRLEWRARQKKMSEWVTWRVKYDLKYVLTHRAVAFHLVHVRKDLFRKFVRMISMAQGMNPSARRFGDHVPVEGDTWVKSFTLEIEMVYPYIELLADAFCGSGAPPVSPGSGSGKGTEIVDLATSRLQCIAIVRSCLDEWIERENALEARSVYTGETFSVAHSVSVHLPLHRFLSFMVHHVLRLDDVPLNIALSGGIGETTLQDAKQLVKHPLRIQSFLAQVRAGMWRRNGRPIAGQSTWYRLIHFSEWFVDLDLFLQQCCAVIMGPDEYTQEMLHAFRIADFSAAIRLPGIAAERRSSEKDARPPISESSSRNGSSESSDGHIDQVDENDWSTADFGLLPLAPRAHEGTGRFPPRSVKGAGNTVDELAGFIPSVIEDLLINLVRVLSERSRCGLDESQFLRRKLVHQLCSGERTHSHLYKACSFRISMELDKDDDSVGENENGDNARSLVESILPEIAEYVEPRGMDQGKYKAKDSIWQEFNSFSPHLSLRDRCAAEVRHAAACERMNHEMQVIPAENVNQRHLFPQLTGLLQLSVAVSRKGGLAREILLKTLPRCGGSQSIEGCIPPALHLVCSAAETEPVSFREGTHCYWLNGYSKEECLQESALGIACEMYKISKDPSARQFKEYEPVLRRILDQVKTRGDAVTQSFLSRELSSVGSTSAASSTTDDDLASQENERRKLILRRKKEQQAAALAQMRLAQASFAKHIDSDVVPKKTSSESPEETCTVVDETASGGGKSSEESIAAAKNEAGIQSPLNVPQAECALCHDTGRGDGTRLMGLIGFHQKTRLPAIATDQCRNPDWVRREDFSDGSEHAQERKDLDTGSGDSPRESEKGGIPTYGSSQFCHSFFLNPKMLRNGVESSQNLHVSFCGHSIHVHCFDRYFTSLMQSRANNSLYEGFNVLDLDKLEFLCPVCRRLANMVLPLMNDIGPKTHANIVCGENVASSLSFGDWVKRCDMEIRMCWNREAAAKQVIAESSGKRIEPISEMTSDETGEIASTVNAMRLSIINSGKAVLQKFGLGSFRSDGFAGEMSELNLPVFNSYAKLPSAAISTVACLEIVARTALWGEPAVQLSRRSLGIVIREARAQIALESEPRKEALKLLWKATVSMQEAKDLDPFAAFAFLFLLWSDPLDSYEAKGLVRLGFNLVQWQKQKEKSEAQISQLTLDLTTLLYLRRAAVLVSSFFDQAPIPAVSVYSRTESSDGIDNVRSEIVRLMKFFDIPTPPDPNLTVGLQEKNSLTLQSATMDFRPQRIGLIQLPSLFQSLLEELDGRKCYSCKRGPKSPALCLVCGALMCSKSRNCSLHRLRTHARACGAGIGVFLVLKITSVHIIREGRTANWGSPYLDAHGEEDENLDRGKPLFLNLERYSALERLWLTHGFDQDSRLLSITVPTRGFVFGF